MTSNSSDASPTGRQRRRRVHRPSVNEHYDRTADRPTGHHPDSWDDDRVVLTDSEDEPLSGIEFWLDQRPPHYGGTS